MMSKEINVGHSHAHTARLIKQYQATDTARGSPTKNLNYATGVIELSAFTRLLITY